VPGAFPNPSAAAGLQIGWKDPVLHVLLSAILRLLCCRQCVVTALSLRFIGETPFSGGVRSD